ncbi:hypothetical protein PMV_040 [Port-miou virus]|uniref:Uncharacterized protein n=1 Tax=Port-miou virus TaxID=1733873 RepID=A0A0N9P6F9_9VIRU|nr:hypothetical protein PMV_040 [Port-miou virus]
MMRSFLKEEVRLFLTNALNIPEEDIFMEVTVIFPNLLEVVYDIKNLVLERNRWRETDRSLLLLNDGRVCEFEITGDAALSALKEDVENVLFSCPEFARQKTKDVQKLQSYVSTLEERIKNLRHKKRKLKYAPGKKGAIQAQQHFEENQ